VDEARYRAAEQRLWRSLGVSPTERFIRLDRIGITVRVQEVGEGPAVVMIHGASNAGTSWAPLVARLDGFRWVTLDRPGCGLSDRLAVGFEERDRLEAFGDALVADVLDAIAVESAHVVATSYGGYMAFRSAAAHPERIRRILEFGWMLGAPVSHTALSMRLAYVPVLGRLMARVPPTRWSVRALLRNIGLRDALASGRFTQEGFDWYLALLRDTDTLVNEIETGPRAIHPIRGMNDELVLPASLLATIDAPVRFIWGTKEPFGSADTARRLADQLPHGELELVPGAGHAVWMDDPEGAAAKTRVFLGA
jgi:pimeloyl-ACP methyl ester carboxylesterase